MWNVILVDDESRILEGLSYLVETINNQYKVIQKFKDGESALSWFESNMSQTDLLITDICLPKMNGLDLIQAVHEKKPALPCIIITGFDRFEYAKRAVSLGVVEFLVKPVDESELKSIMERMTLVRSQHITNQVIIRSDLSSEVSYIKDQIETNYRDFSISKAADYLHLNKNYLSRIFKKEVGVNIMEYLTDIRMNQAKRFLSMGSKYKVYEVGIMVGYDDNVYFSKQFKRKFGVSPKDYQKHYI